MVVAILTASCCFALQSSGRSRAGASVVVRVVARAARGGVHARPQEQGEHWVALSFQEVTTEGRFEMRG